MNDCVSILILQGGYMFLRSLPTLMLFILLVGCSKPQIITRQFKDEDIIHFSQMKNDNDIIDHVIYLNKGDKIPVEMKIESKLLEADKDKIHLVLKQKVYLRLVLPEGMITKDISAMSEKEKQSLIERSMIFVSPDAKKWARYTEMKAIKQLFGISGGSFSIGFGITKEGGPQLKLTAITRKG